MLTAAETVARIERRASAWNAGLAAGLKEASRERAKGRRAAQEAADARALVARIVAQREAREAAETGPALYTDNASSICPALGMLAAWADRDARGTVAACPETFARRVFGIADLVADLARIALALDLGGYETAAELQARTSVPAETLNRTLPKARSVADIAAHCAGVARYGCNLTAAAVRQGCGPTEAIPYVRGYSAAAAKLCAWIVDASRAVLWSREAQATVRQDVRNAVGALFIDNLR